MQKFTCLVLSIALVSAPVLPCLARAADATSPPDATAGSAACTEQGREAGRRTSTTGAFTIGLVSGFGLGLIGTGLAWAFQGEPQPPAASVQALENAECRIAYAGEYGRQGRAKKRLAVLTGGLVGTALIVGVVAGANRGSD